MPETCENWLGVVNNYIYYACQTSKIYQVLPYSVDFKVHRELWNPLNKTVLSKCNFILNKGSLNIWSDPKARKWLICQTCKYFPNHAVPTKDFLNDCKTQKYIICQTCKCIPNFLHCKVIYTNWSQTQPQCTNVSIYKQLSTLEWDSSPHLTVWQHCNHFIAVLYLAAYPRRK